MIESPRLSSQFPVETSVLEGDPGEELLAISARSRNALVVMATHGKGGLRRLVFGSMADRLVREGSVPVAVIRGAAGTPIDRRAACSCRWTAPSWLSGGCRWPCGLPRPSAPRSILSGL